MAIEVCNVSKRFGDFQALDDVSLEVPAGSLTALLGPSGSGKSTLLRVIAGLEQPDTGAIAISGEDATDVVPQKRGVGFVFQHYAAFKHMTVRDNVAFGLTIRKRPKAEIRERVSELLELVQLAPFGDRYPAQLSGGQRQRMALARALAVEPKVLLLDEPFGALDARVRAELRKWLRRLHEDVHVTTVFVTHDQEEAMDVADQIVVMNRGVVEQVGSPRDLYEEPTSEFVMGFVGPTAHLDGVWVRPHDVELLTQPVENATEAMIERIVHLGFEVRVELVCADASTTSGAADARRLRGARARGGPDRLRAGDEIGQRGLLEHAAHARSELDPDVAQPGGRAGVGDVLRPGAADGRDRTFDRADHVRDADVSGRLREPVATLGAALARHDLGAAQLEQDVLEELERDLLRRRQPLRLHEAGRRRRQLRDRAQRIVHLRRDPHGRILSDCACLRSASLRG